MPPEQKIESETGQDRTLDFALRQPWRDVGLQRMQAALENRALQLESLNKELERKHTLLVNAQQAAQVAHAKELKLLSDLALAHSRLEAITASVPDILFLLGLDEKILWWNGHVEQLTGRTPEEIASMSASDLLAEDRSDVMLAIQHAITTGYVKVEMRFLTKNGPVPYEFHSVPMHSAEGELIGVAGSGRDISERLATAETIREAQRTAEGANQLKSRFLANMSHEIRTPMTAILGYAQLLLDEEYNNSPQRRIEAVQTIQRNGEHLLNIINDILDLSKIEAEKLTVESVAYSPVAIVEEVLSLMRVRSEAKKIELTVEYPTPLPTTIQTDPTRLRQILVNLVGNAIKFTQDGQVRLIARLADGETLEFDVVDTGIGMTHSQRRQLFQPFSQASSATCREFAGSGLGLAISKQLAVMLGGDVRIVESILGRGSRFRISIATGPLDNVEMLDHAQTIETSGLSARKPKSREPACSLVGGRILLAEDGLDNQRLIAFILRKAGAEVVIVENGQLAVEAAMLAVKMNRPFEVILMDMQMPVLDGYGAVALLRAKNYREPIIALTAHAMTGDREKCLSVGCDDFATKPLNPEELISQVAAFINISPSARYSN